MSVVVAAVNAKSVNGAGFAANAPSPGSHANVVDAAAMLPVTVKTSTVDDGVAAVTVPALLVHVGTLPATKAALSAVIVIVSEISLTPAVPVANAVTGTTTNVRLVGVSPASNSFDAADVNAACVAARRVKPDCAISVVVSCVVTMSNVMVAANGVARMAPSPVAHSIVCTVEAVSAFEATVSVTIMADDVAASSVAAVLPTVTVHRGTFPGTQIAALAVIVMVPAGTDAGGV